MTDRRQAEVDFHRPLKFAVDPETKCHVFQGALNDRGYGIVGLSSKLTMRAHRVAYAKVHGLIPDGLQLDHKCRNRACINPEHLEPVTNAENSRRGAKSKITMDIARQIRAEYAAGGCTFRGLGKKYDLPGSAISNIINNKRWAE